MYNLGHGMRCARDRYAAVAFFLGLRTDFGCDFATVFRLAAQKAFILSACCLRCAAVKVRFFLDGAATGIDGSAASRFWGGRLGRFAGP